MISQVESEREGERERMRERERVEEKAGKSKQMFWQYCWSIEVANLLKIYLVEIENVCVREQVN